MLLIIPGKPISKKRPRFARVGKGVRTYSIQDTEESLFLMAIKDKIKQKFSGPLEIKFGFFLQRPKSHFGTGANANRLKPHAPKYPTTKPDLDNYEKFALDCMNGIAYDDDALIVSMHSEKCYTEKDPRTVIMIQPFIDSGF